MRLLFSLISRIALVSVLGLSNCAQRQFPKTSVETQANLNPKKSNDLSQKLPIPEEITRWEGFGILKIGLTAAQVVKVLGSPESKSKNILWGADGLYHQYWYYPKQGITLDMVSVTGEEKQKVASIKLTSNSTLKTRRGIKIGDSYAKVTQAYYKERDRETSTSSKIFVAGSIYGGLIFSFKNGRVNEIFLGAAAE